MNKSKLVKGALYSGRKEYLDRIYRELEETKRQKKNKSNLVEFLIWENPFRNY